MANGSASKGCRAQINEGDRLTRKRLGSHIV